MNPPTPSRDSLVVVGLARDCASALKKTLAFCEALERAFVRTYFVFVENDSKDATRSIIEAWVDGRGNAEILTPDNASDADLRTERIAACRNAALAFVGNKLAEYHLLLNVDMDLDVGADDAGAIVDAANFVVSSNETAGVFPNSSPVYYDVYALRHPFWCPDDVWQKVADGWKNYADPYLAVPEAQLVYSRQMFIPQDLAPIKVVSAFGGAGLYRLQAAISGHYRGVDDAGHETCEHVIFNKGLDGDLYILPRWCIDAPTEHISCEFRTDNTHEAIYRKRRQRRAFRNRLIEKWLYFKSFVTRIVNNSSVK